MLNAAKLTILCLLIEAFPLPNVPAPVPVPRVRIPDHPGRGGQIPRSEVDLHYRRVGGGSVLWTTILVAGKAIDALVDTGSTALVVFSSALDEPQSLAKGPSTWTSYGDGERFDGQISRVPVLFSKDASSTVPVMLATSVKCVPLHPHCPAEGVDFTHYRFGGKGGFGAILGIGIGQDKQQPFAAAGIKRWIVDWPNSKIILNPDDRDLDGFVFHHRVVDRETISGCLAGASKRVCGPILLDTGTTGIVLFTKDATNYEEIRSAGTYFLTLGDRRDAQAIHFTAPPYQYELAGANDTTPAAIVAGTPVVGDLAISYDPLHGVIGVKPAKPPKPDPIEPDLLVSATNAIPPLGTLPLGIAQRMPSAQTAGAPQAAGGERHNRDDRRTDGRVGPETPEPDWP
jgi:hypothetical protein